MLCGIVTLRMEPAPTAGPRVSITRHGVTGINCSPDVCAVMKFAVTVCGAVMVTVVDALVVLATGPVQFTNAKPLFATAVIGTTVPVSANPPTSKAFGGIETVPAPVGDTAVVSEYCVLKVAV